MRKYLRRVIVFVLSIAALLAAILVVRTARLPSRQIAVPPGTPIEVDAVGASQVLAKGIQLETIASAGGAPESTAPFLLLHRYLEQVFPATHRELAREVVNEYSLLFRWDGSDSTRAPGLFMSHLDVVPADPRTAESWKHPPFGGVLAAGTIWGRGALDVKSGVFGLFEAIEHLIAEGFQPAQTIYFAFGHDEETGGARGNGAIAERLRARGIQFEYVVDEGGFIAERILTVVDRPVALVGIAEKGYLSVELRAEATGGHSSTPPKKTAIGAVARAIAAIEADPFPTQMSGATEEMLAFLAPESSYAVRLGAANLWLSRPLVEGSLAADTTTAALVRTTVAPTILDAGVKDNVLPESARAVVNLRILPGETVATTLDRLREIVGPEIRIESVGASTEPSPVSSTDSRAFRALQHTISESFPNVIVAPYLVFGATDSRHYAKIADDVYRFLPLWVTDATKSSIHGVNERISVENYGELIEFLVRLLRRLAGE